MRPRAPFHLLAAMALFSGCTSLPEESQLRRDLETLLEPIAAAVAPLGTSGSQQVGDTARSPSVRSATGQNAFWAPNDDDDDDDDDREATAGNRGEGSVGEGGAAPGVFSPADNPSSPAGAPDTSSPEPPAPTQGGGGGGGGGAVGAGGNAPTSVGGGGGESAVGPGGVNAPAFPSRP